MGRKIAREELSPEAYIIDGTGFSYHDLYPLNLLRGTQVRMVQSHVRAVVMAGFSKGRRFILKAVSGQAYASEVKMGSKLLADAPLSRGSPFLADKAYDSIEFLELVKAKGCIPAVRIKGNHSLHQTIKHPLRLESANISSNKELYDKRAQIEGLFGNTKEKLGSHIRVFRTDIAQRFALMRLSLFNISLLCKLQGVCWWIFRTVSA